MKKWSAAIYLSAVLGVFVGSGYACGASIGLFGGKDKVIVTDPTITVLNDNGSSAGSVDVSASFEGEKVEGYVGGKIKHSSDVKLTATPVSSDYKFVGWFRSDGSLYSRTNPLTITATTDLVLHARFKLEAPEAIVHTITLFNTPIEVDGRTEIAGSVTGADQYADGEKVVLTATPYVGYTFLGWYGENDTFLSKTLTYEFDAEESKNITAKWGLQKYDVVLVANSSTAGTVIGAGEYEHGKTCTATANTKGGYTFLGWFEDGKDEPVSTANIYTFTVDKARTLTAKWELPYDQYTVTVANEEEEKGTATGGGVVVEGESVTLTATAKTGYEFAGWHDGTQIVSESATYTFVPSQDMTFTATWKTADYEISIVKSHEEAGDVEGAKTYTHGAVVTLTATENPGYEFAGWYVNGSRKTKNTTYTFTAEEDVEVEARWTAITYVVEISKNLASAGDVEGAGTKNYNELVTLEATVNEGYAFLGWYENDVLIEGATGLTYTFNATSDRNITAMWEQTAFEIVYLNDQESAGTISATGLGVNGICQKGDSITLTATPNEGYDFLGWYDGVTPVSTALSYTFEPNRNMTLTAKWKLSDDAVFDATKLGEITGWVESLTAQLGTRQSIPVVYAEYDGQVIRAFPWVTYGTSKTKVNVGSRGTKFLVSSSEVHTIHYYIEVGGPQLIKSTTVTVSDSTGPSFSLPASADGMLVYKDKEVTLPDWTAKDPSGVNGDTIVSVTYNGSDVDLTEDGKFTPTQFGKYVVTYTAYDNVGNKGEVTFTIECKRMVEICDFDDASVANGYGYTASSSTYAEFSEEFRYGDEGSSLKLTGVGVGQNDFVKVVAIPTYYDLSGFDEIAVYVWSDQALTGISAGIYLLNNRGYGDLPLNIQAGENIVKFSKEQIWADYTNGKVMDGDMEANYLSSDHIWLQIRAPQGCNIYIDNMVGIFNDYTGADTVAPVIDLGVGKTIADSKAVSGNAYGGQFGSMTCWVGDTLKSTIEANVHAYDNSVSNVTYDYTVKDASGSDITSAVKNGTLTGALGATYTVTAWAVDGEGNRSEEKSVTMVVRDRYLEHTAEGHQMRTLNSFVEESALSVTCANVSLDEKVNKNGRVKVVTKGFGADLISTITTKLELLEALLTPESIDAMEYVNFRIFTYNAGAEFYIGDTLLRRLSGGWNDITIDKSLLNSAYNFSTGEVTFKVYSANEVSVELILDSIQAVYEAGTAPGEEELPTLNRPSVSIDGATGIASWEAVPNAIGYWVSINGGTPVQYPATTLSVQLTNDQTISVGAIGDGTNYADSPMTQVQLFLDGADILNDCEEAGPGVFEAGTTPTTSIEHVVEGSKSVKATLSGWTFTAIYLKKSGGALDITDYEYIEMTVYVESGVGGRLLYANDNSSTAHTFTAGQNVIQLPVADLVSWGTYNSENDTLTFWYAIDNGVLYFDKVIGKLDPNAGKTVLLSPRVTVDDNGLATWTEVTGATAYAYRINGGEEVQVPLTQTSFQLENIGDTIQVRSIGDGETYLSGEYSIAHEWLDPNATEVVLNNCESVGGWVQAANTPTISTSNVFEGSSSIEVTSATDWWWLNVRILETGMPLAELQEKYETIKLNIYSSYPDTAAGEPANTLWLGNGALKATTLKQGDNIVEIDTYDLTSAMYAYADGGYFITFYVGGASTLRVDNVVGVKRTTSALTQCTAPTVSVNSDTGVASWTAVDGATKYLYKINGGAEQETTTTSVTLTAGQSIQVMAVGNGTTHRDSEYSTSAIYTPVSSTDVMLNNCESVGGWVQAGNTPILSTSNVFEGSSSIEVVVGDGGWINVRILETGINLATLQATYEKITLNVYSSYEGTNTNTLWLGDAVGEGDALTADWNRRIVARLSQGDNVVEIPTSMLDDSMYVTDGAGGYFLSFRVGGASTIRIDNVVGTPKA